MIKHGGQHCANFRAAPGFVRSAGSCPISRILRTGNRTQPAPTTCTNRLAFILKQPILNEMHHHKKDYHEKFILLLHHTFDY